MEAGRRRTHVENEAVSKRQGTVWTATAHCTTAVIGSGVLALAWSVAQLGWILGPFGLLAFSAMTYYTSILLADCYRYPDPINGTRNPTYMSVVRSYLGPKNVIACGIVQFTILWGSMVSYTITSATSMRNIMLSKCSHCSSSASGNIFMIIFGAVGILLSQFPNLEEVTWLSILAAVMSFGYSTITLGLGVAKWISHGDVRGSLMGVMSRNVANVSPASKTWRSFQALGNIAFSYTYSDILIEIQDTLKSPPSENVTMKKAGLYIICVTTIFYMTIACVGYAAFGNSAPGNILTGFDEPFWLVDIANVFIVVYTIGAYQVFARPIFAIAEKKIASKWPESAFFHNVYTIRVPFTKTKSFPIMPTRIIMRSFFIVFTTLVAMLLPFFNAIMGWLGAATFWPLTVYFPINMYLSQRKIKQGTGKWFFVQGLCFGCLVICLAAMIGSTADIIDKLKHAKPFHAKY